MSHTEQQGEAHSRIGVGVMILKEGKVLLSKRKVKLGEGSWAFPGGHLEYMESFEECSRREIAEECGVEVANFRFLYLANLKLFVPKHYIHVTLVADWISGEPQIREPDKSGEWGWYALDALPTPLFPTCTMAIESYQTGINYRDNVLTPPPSYDPR